MDIQDQRKTTAPSGHEGHGVHTCHRCGWPFPNPHPSSKHRRAHKKVCGTIEGYAKLIDSGAVSDDEHHSDEDKEKTPSLKIEKRIIKESGSGAGVIEERSNRSEDDLFSDAVTEFSDSGVSPGVEERLNGNGDSFQTFKDAENAGATELLESPIEVRKEDDVLEAFETPDTHTKDADKTEENNINAVCDLAEAKIKLPESDVKASDPFVEDRDGSHKDKFIGLLEPSTTVQAKPDSTKAVDVGGRHVDTFEVSDKKEQGEEAVYVLSVPSDIPLVDHSETLIDNFKDHETIYSNVPLSLGADDDKDMENRSMVDTYEVKTVEEKSQEIHTSGNGESSVVSTISQHTNTDYSAFVPAVITQEAKVGESQPSEMSKTVPEAADNLIGAEVSPNVMALGERTEAAAAEGTSEEIKQEMFGSDHEHAPKVVKEAEIDHSVSVLTEDDLASKKRTEAYTREIVEKPGSGIEGEQKAVENVGVDSKDSGSIGISERSEKLILEEAEQLPNAAGVVSETMVDEGKGKLMTSHDCGADVSVGSSSRNSLEGNWGSVSVLSTASIDAENAHSIDKSRIATDKNRLGKSDVFEPPSLVEEEIVDQKASEIKAVAVQNSQPPPKSEASQAGWFPSVANISSESEGRKRNKEAIAKVTNWSTSEHSTTPLKNLASEAKSSNPKQLSTMIQQDEVAKKTNSPGKSNLASGTPLANQELSPPKYISEGKKVRKKVKGRASWVPFACCSSVNVN